MVAKGTRRRVTLAEVARAAGVSTATVSYALNSKPNGRIPDETKRRIQAVAQDLGYTPNVAAQALRTGKSRVILIIIPHLPINFTIGEMMTEFGSQLDARGYVAAMLTTGAHKMDLEATVNATAPAAAVTMVALSDEERALLHARGITVLETQFGLMKSDVAWFSRVQQRMVHQQLEHLLDIGHTRIGWAHPVDSRLQALADARRDIAIDYLRSHGLNAPLVQSYQLSGKQADKAVAQWKSQGITAVACYNDLWAMSVVEAARRAAIDVPKELAVIGIDNIPLTEIVEPPLTSISLDMPKHVEAQLQTIFAMMHGTAAPEPDEATLIKFVRRGST